MDFIVGFFVLKELEYSLGDEDYLRSEPSQMPGWNILFSMDNAGKEKNLNWNVFFILPCLLPQSPPPTSIYIPFTLLRYIICLSYKDLWPLFYLGVCSFYCAKRTSGAYKILYHATSKIILCSSQILLN